MKGQATERLALLHCRQHDLTSVNIDAARKTRAQHGCANHMRRMLSAGTLRNGLYRQSEYTWVTRRIHVMAVEGKDVNHCRITVHSSIIPRSPDQEVDP